MIQVVDKVREIVNSKPWTVNVKSVTDHGDGTFTIYTCNTSYLNTRMKVEIDSVEYTVVSFVYNESVTLSGTPVLPIGLNTLPTPYFTHGKYSAVNKELGRITNHNTWNPLIWLLELTTRDISSDYDSKFDSEGSVMLFFMSTSDWKNYDTSDHYTEVIKPMSNVVDNFIALSKRHLGVKDLGYSSTNHAKFTTGGSGVQVSGNKVLPDTQSGIELSLSLPIIKESCNC